MTARGGCEFCENSKKERKKLLERTPLWLAASIKLPVGYFYFSSRFPNRQDALTTNSGNLWSPAGFKRKTDSGTRSDLLSVQKNMCGNDHIGQFGRQNRIFRKIIILRKFLASLTKRGLVCAWNFLMKKSTILTISLPRTFLSFLVSYCIQNICSFMKNTVRMSLNHFCLQI